VDAAACRRLASDLALPLTIVTLPDELTLRHPGVGVEEAARRERYVALAAAAETAGASIVATAHHRQDQAETVLLHLLRGAGLRGASGMAEVTPISVPWWPTAVDDRTRRLAIWRPFLDEPRDVVRGYLTARGLSPVADPTNEETRYRRNRLRHEALPLLKEIVPGAEEALARFARLARADDALLTSLAAAALDRATADSAHLAIGPLRDEPVPIRRRVVLLWLDRLGVGPEVTLERVEAILAAAERGRGGSRIEVARGWSVVARRGLLTATPPVEHRRSGRQTTGEDKEAS
jgi:tRNA(Ile)-lysidine synthetase-like protein